MNKVALIFVLAVFVPSLLLAWLAFGSVRDQELVAERQRTLLVQAATDELARAVDDEIKVRQRRFGEEVEEMAARSSLAECALEFDRNLKATCARIGFVVTIEGHLICPTLTSHPLARTFRSENERFLTSQETVEVRFESPKGAVKMTSQLDRGTVVVGQAGKVPAKTPLPPMEEKGPVEVAEFRQLIGDAAEGTLARFHEDRLKVLLWYRSPQNPDLVFGAEVDLDRLVEEISGAIRVPAGLVGELAIALLDHTGRARAVVPRSFTRLAGAPFASSDPGEALPHWRVAAFWLDEARLNRSTRTVELMLGLLVAVLVLAIGTGGWLVVNDLNRQLKLSRQKTDFVSNVSHELKTPLTSIGMFSELLAGGRVEDPVKQRRFLNIITAETARLTRLIDNVLDFARMERGEQEYRLLELDLREVVDEIVQSYRSHLEERGFRFQSRVSDVALPVRGDRDALARVLVNLLSNVEKYSGERKEVEMETLAADGDGGWVEVRVMDRGLGVPRAWEGRIFEQFTRAHDSLSSGIKGSGLGLTLARQIARAHGGDLTYQAREGGGSCFTLRLPRATSSDQGSNG